MGANLDIFDAVSGHPQAELELAELLLSQKRYDTIRKMNLRQFKVIYMRNLTSNDRFDDLVDAEAGL